VKRDPLSASNLHAAALCPAKPRMEAPYGERSRPDSERGTDLHTYFRTGKSYDALSPSDRETMESADRYADEFLARFRETHGIAEYEPFLEFHEVALTGDVPGHADNIIVWPDLKLVVIMDFSGFIEVEDAPSNYQLAAYSALIWKWRPFVACGVAIIQPNAFGPRLTSAIYEAAQMPTVLDVFKRIRDATLDPEAAPVAGEVQCRWCKAKEVCPAFTAGFSQLATLDKSLAVETLSAPDLGALKQIIQRAKQLSDSVDDEMRKRIEAGTMPGWRLGNSGTTRRLVDGVGLFQAMQSQFPDTPEFATRYNRCLEMVWGRIEELYASIAGISEAKAKEFVRELAAPFVEENEKEKRILADKPVKLK